MIEKNSNKVNKTSYFSVCYHHQLRLFIELPHDSALF